METASSKVSERAITPEVGTSSYYLVTGERGLGRSSSAVHGADLLYHRGVIYCQVPAGGNPKDFEISLAGRLFLHHLIYDKLFSYASLLVAFLFLDFPMYDGDKKTSYIEIILKQLRVISEQYEIRNEGKIPVLIIDQVNNFLKVKRDLITWIFYKI
jgi:hypothetical protein